MLNRKPMSRSGFKRPAIERAPRAPLVPVTGCRGVYAPVGGDVVAVPKDSRELLLGDEARLWAHVRSLPCARCWREGRTQVSHSNQLIDGKGRSLKAYPWRVAALCDLCHASIDQGKELSKAEKREEWERAHRWTMGKLFELQLVRPT